MFEPAVIVLRWIQMTGAMILFGSSLFFLYALPHAGPSSAATQRWPQRLLIISAGVLFAACVLGLMAQTVVLAGSFRDGMTFESLDAVLSGMSFGKSSAVRAGLAALLLLSLPFLKSGPGTWRFVAAAGAAICASFAWMGHGAATQGVAGVLHAAGDIAHTLAAGVWIGALVAFLILLAIGYGEGSTDHDALHAALRGFSGIGAGLVAVLVATGLINGWFVIGWPGVLRLLATPYGLLFMLKMVLFIVMLGLAAANRFLLTPMLGRALSTQTSPHDALKSLRQSLALETGVSFAVLGLVAWFGALQPPAVL